MTRHLWFLASRKVQSAVATVLVAVLAQYGFEADESTVLAVVAVGAALILGIAHEDNGRNQRSGAGRGAEVR